jgi:OmcA/MtrC family decaheme c-type cytochrome
MRIDKSVFIRFCLTAMMAFSLAVTGCGNDGQNGQDGQDGQDGDDGMDGEQGPPGPAGPPGGTPPGAGDVVDISNPATEELLNSFGDPLVAEITDVTVSSPPVVDFTLKTEGGADVTGLNPEFVSGTFVKLVAAAAGKRSHWVSYMHEQETGDMPKTCKLGDEEGNLCSVDDDCPVGTCTVDSPAVPDDPGARQADNGGGSLVDNGDGSYTFTYTADPTTSTDPTWEPNLTHRAGLEIRINDTLNPDNPTFDLVPDGGAGSGNKDILSTDTCNNCHGRLGLHGGGTGGRFTVEYCVTCHNDQSRDQGWGESIDMAHMAHSIHGNEVREFQETEFKEFAYWILGRDPHDYTETTYPNTIIDCATCHTMTEETPDGDAWKTSVDSLSCGGCHVAGLTISPSDTTTGLSTYSYTHQIVPAIGVKVDGDCVNCHSPTTAPDPPNSASAEVAHRNVIAEAMENFALQINSVANGLVCDAGSQAGNTCASDADCAPLVCADGDDVGEPCASDDACTNGTCDTTPDGTCDQDVLSIKFTVSNPTDTSTYDITAADGPFADEGARVRFYVAWSTNDYSNHDTPSSFRSLPLAVDVIDGDDNFCNTPPAGFTCTGPDETDGSFTITEEFERPFPDPTGDSWGISMVGRAVVDANRIPIQSQIAYLAVRGICEGTLDEECDFDTDCLGTCEKKTTPRREIADIMLCNDCHGMLSEHGDGYTDNVQVCATCHNADLEGADLKVMIHGIHDANREGRTNVTYPRHRRLTNECNACHLGPTYYPQDTTTEQGFRYATTTEEGVNPPSDDINTTFNAATCGSCHLPLDDGAVEAAHMVQNGSSFLAVQLVNGDIVEPDPAPVETCVTCHGPDKSQDVGVVHPIE